ncbi:MAG TPA: hypothetical protein VK669_10935 [Candidatus Limnocylindrales bacterium]|nr:hypothetical protein [Candidatus Limnocylindrales bacterium]
MYAAGQTVELRVAGVQNRGGPISTVVASYRIADERNMPSREPNLQPQQIAFDLGPPQSFSDDMRFSGVVPKGIVGGRYIAMLMVSTPDHRQVNFDLSGSYAIDIADDPGHALPPLPDLSFTD